MTAVKNPLACRNKLCRRKCLREVPGQQLCAQSMFFKRSQSAKVREGYAKGNTKLINKHELHLRKAAVREGTRRVREG